MIERNKLTLQLNKISQSLQDLGVVCSSLYPFVKAAVDAAREFEEKMIAFNNDATGSTQCPGDYYFLRCDLSTLGQIAIDLNEEKCPANAEEVIAWRKRKKIHAFKCFFKARVSITRKKVKRPYKKKVRINYERNC